MIIARRQTPQTVAAAGVAAHAVTSAPAARPTSRIDRWCLTALGRAVAGVPVRLVLWDGTALAGSPEPPMATVRIHDRRALLGLLWDTDRGFGEAYTDGRLIVDGDLVGLLTELSRRLPAVPRRSMARQLRRTGARVAQARRNVHQHYDRGNDFFRLWLDDEMVYTCAYFATPDATLEAAQRAKLEHVARKLELRPGERVFEAGCGWGALALHLARHHGVTVRAWNLSRPQLEWARDRARREGLADRVEFVEDDYRRITGTCDAFVSVGMLEHVGRRQYESLGEVIDRTLDRRHGRGLLHFIGRNARAPRSGWIDRHIFPGYYLPSLREALEGVLEPRALSVLDVENLRPHYARTLACWLERFERASAAVTDRLGERFTRMWRLYLAGAQAGFASGQLQLFQVTFARGQCDGLRWTRDALYR